ncbi:MAG: hypothetical protein WCK82_16070 [Bacteroidota bacterium]
MKTSNLYLWATILLVGGCLIVALLRLRRTEPFGFSNGTLVQLATSHVPTLDDEGDAEAEMAQIRHDLRDMTGSA